jgi:hypothetical protein
LPGNRVDAKRAGMITPNSPSSDASVMSGGRGLVGAFQSG